MRLLRRVGAAVTVVLLIALGVAAVFPNLGWRAISPLVGQDIRADGISWAGWGTLSIETATLRSKRGSVRCTNVRARPALVASLRHGASFRELSAEHCLVELASAAGVANAIGDSPDADATVRSIEARMGELRSALQGSVRASLIRLERRLQRADIETTDVTVGGQHLASAHDAFFVVESNRSRLGADVSIEPRDGVVVDGALRVQRGRAGWLEGELVSAPGASCVRIRAQDVELCPERIGFDSEGGASVGATTFGRDEISGLLNAVAPDAELGETIAADRMLDGISLHIDELTFASPWREIEAAGVKIRGAYEPTRPARPGSPEPPPRGALLGVAPEDMPPNTLDFALDRLRDVAPLLETLLELPRIPAPPVDVRLTSVELSAGTQRHDIAELRVSTDGRLTIAREEAGATVSVHQAVDEVHFTAENAPLNELLPGSPVTAGVADFTFSIVGAERPIIELSAAARGAAISHPGLSDVDLFPVDVTVTASCAVAPPVGTPHPQETDVSCEATGLLNGVPLTAAIAYKNERLETSIGTDGRVRCQRMWEALPPGLVHNLGENGVRFTGSAAPELQLTYRRGNIQSLLLTAEGFPESCTIEVLNPEYDPEQLDSDRYLHHVREGVESDNIFVGPATTSYVSLSSLPDHVPAAMYLSEEIAFYRNGPLSVPLINRAIRYSLPRGRFAYGGSTVKQQLVKNLFFYRSKTLARKLQEALVAWAMTDTLSHDRILELYTNCVEFGPDIWGVSDASWHYFEKPPHQLTPIEAAFLAAIKPSPGQGEDFRRRGQTTSETWMAGRLRTLLMRMHRNEDLISEWSVEASAPWVVYFNGMDANELPVDEEAIGEPHEPNASANPREVPGSEALLPPD